MEEFKRIATVLPYLKQPSLVLRASVPLGFFAVLWRVADPAIVVHLKQDDARAVLLTIIFCGFAVVCLVMWYSVRSSGPRG